MTLDSDPQTQMNADPTGSGSTSLKKTGVNSRKTTLNRIRTHEKENNDSSTILKVLKYNKRTDQIRIRIRISDHGPGLNSNQEPFCLEFITT